MVGERDRLQAQAGGLLGQLLGVARPVEEAVVGVRVQLGVRDARSPTARGRGRGRYASRLRDQAGESPPSASAPPDRLEPVRPESAASSSDHGTSGLLHPMPERSTRTDVQNLGSRLPRADRVMPRPAAQELSTAWPRGHTPSRCDSPTRVRRRGRGALGADRGVGADGVRRRGRGAARTGLARTGRDARLTIPCSITPSEPTADPTGTSATGRPGHLRRLPACAPSPCAPLRSGYWR